MKPPTALEVTDLVVRYKTLTAVDHLSFCARSGEVLAVLGPNGAGKTSTIETLEGYRIATSGTVKVLGLDPIGDHRVLVPKIGVMLQQGGMYSTMNARDALRLFASFYDTPRPANELLEMVGLDNVAKTPWRRLSGGEQRRLALALALVGNPQVVFLDEPTAGVDLEGRLLIRKVVSALRADGACIVLATHELDEAERISDNVMIIDKGIKVAEGSPAALKGQYGCDRLEDVFLAVTRDRPGPRHSESDAKAAGSNAAGSKPVESP